MLLRTGKKTEKWIAFSVDAAVSTMKRKLHKSEEKIKGLLGIIKDKAMCKIFL